MTAPARQTTPIARMRWAIQAVLSMRRYPSISAAVAADAIHRDDASRLRRTCRVSGRGLRPRQRGGAASQRTFAPNGFAVPPRRVPDRRRNGWHPQATTCSSSSPFGEASGLRNATMGASFALTDYPRGCGGWFRARPRLAQRPLRPCVRRRCCCQDGARISFR